MQLITSAQSDTTTKEKDIKKFVINENTIVKDSLGNVIPYFTWLNGIRKRTHILAPNFEKEGEFIYKSTVGMGIIYRQQNPNKPDSLKNYVLPSKYFETNTKFNYFSARTIDGKRINAKNLQDKIVVVNFWFTNCGPCKFEIPDLNEIVDKYANKTDVVFLAVALDDEEKLDAFFKGLQFKYEHIANGNDIANKYGIKGYPTHLIVDKKGVIRFHTTGLSTNTTNALQNKIEELVNEK
ncbi:MAG: TlpA family protein disulfide reductase [Chitinophagaceae bacterium]